MVLSSTSNIAENLSEHHSKYSVNSSGILVTMGHLDISIV